MTRNNLFVYKKVNGSTIYYANGRRSQGFLDVSHAEDISSLGTAIFRDYRDQEPNVLNRVPYPLNRTRGYSPLSRKEISDLKKQFLYNIKF